MHWWPRQTPRIGTQAPNRSIDGVADAGLVRRAGAGGDDDVGGCQSLDRGEVERVVAHDEALVAELADVAGEVPDEAVVVVDQEDHQPPLSAATSARAFASVSSYSAAGSLSAVMPPPAWKVTVRPFRQ